MDKQSRIYVAGHAGLVGSAVVRRLEAAGFTNILTATREQLDLRDQAEVSHWFKANRPEYVFLVAGTVGGIMANSTRPAEFIYDNMMIHGTVVHAAHEYGVTKLLYLGSSCIYPRQATQPITEEQLLTGPLEPTNEWYAIAKIAGIKLCQAYRRQYGCDFISAMPTNLYGPNDNFDLTSSHVLPALIRKFHDAKASGVDRSRDLGHRLTDARVPPRRRPRRRLPAPDGALQRRQPHQRRHRRRPLDPRTRREGPRHRLPRGRRCGSTPPSPTAHPARCSTSPSSAATRLEAEDRPRHRHPLDLPMVPRPTGQRTSTSAASTTSPPRVADFLHATNKTTGPTRERDR